MVSWLLSYALAAELNSPSNRRSPREGPPHTSSVDENTLLQSSSARCLKRLRTGKSSRARACTVPPLAVRTM
eukprot:scaffold152634_cov31-Tisochrysis_lutea.AAC.7